MKGFCEKGILLFPKVETLTARDIQYEMNLKYSAKNLVNLFKRYDIILQCFTTNEVARHINPEGIEWINSSSPEDMFFLSNNYDSNISVKDAKQLDDFYVSTRKKYPVERGLSVENRFDIAVKRDLETANTYIKESKLVIDLQHKNNKYYKTSSVNEDGRIVLFVDYSTFVITTYLSGEIMNTNEILMYDDRRPLYCWEVE